MKNLSLLLFLFISFQNLPAQEETYTIPALQDPVEIIIDQWGIPHIYAENEADLFFAQGFNAARHRLFQFEVWRRQATGTVAEILGKRELKRDIGTRLFMFRGDMQEEMKYYHDRGDLIITSFVAGVNAYIEQTEKNPKLLPMEFGLLGIKPQKWTPEVVISRHQGLLGNIGEELAIARLVALVGEEKTRELAWFHPQKPDLTIDPKINKDLLFDDILELYNAYRKPVAFQPDDLIGDVANDMDYYRSLAQADEQLWQKTQLEAINDIGSNNWVISGEHTESGYPMMANDPHRRQAAPSLRYMAHLVCPGWNVIGGGEPEIPGISIGHNEYGTWGLTVFRTDGEDLYVYETNPKNASQYRYKGEWKDMEIIQEQITVKGQKKPVKVDLKYTIHGPVVYEDEENQVAYAVRCAWAEAGGSPYLASLRMNQSKNFEEFREACNYSHIPGENMVWADRAGNIGWQAVGIAPIRRSWSGLVPILGDGSYEWDGYLPIIEKPNVYNPSSGIFGTSNENVTPNDYKHWDAIAYGWSDPYRGDRVMEVLANGRQHSLMDMAVLQTDYLSIPARQLLPLLQPLKSDNPKIQKAMAYLYDWDFYLSPNSIAAGIYNAWEKQIKRDMTALVVPEKVRPYVSLQMKKVIDWLVLPDGKFGKDAIAGRDAFLLKSLERALGNLEKQLGADMEKWQYGQTNYKHIVLKHPLSNAVKPEIRQQLDVGPAPRGGNSYTVNNTSGNDNQSHGGSFRMIVDTGDWDRTLATNAPGQSGNPESEQYRNLFEVWARDGYFPMFYSRAKVEGVKWEVIWLKSK